MLARLGRYALGSHPLAPGQIIQAQGPARRPPIHQRAGPTGHLTWRMRAKQAIYGNLTKYGRERKRGIDVPDTSNSKDETSLGFLTVLRQPEFGLCGGYLVLNPLGRPLEFHCTAPIQANRAQEILYGPTLEEFLFGEQIGRTLLEKPAISVSAVFVDMEPVLAARQFVDLPMALVLPPDSHKGVAPGSTPTEGDASHGFSAFSGSDPWFSFALGGNQLAVPAAYQTDRETIAGRLDRLSAAFDLNEPFGRIREAIAEARKAA